MTGMSVYATLLCSLIVTKELLIIIQVQIDTSLNMYLTFLL